MIHSCAYKPCSVTLNGRCGTNQTNVIPARMCLWFVRPSDLRVDQRPIVAQWRPACGLASDLTTAAHARRASSPPISALPPAPTPLCKPPPASHPHLCAFASSVVASFSFASASAATSSASHPAIEACVAGHDKHRSPHDLLPQVSGLPLPPPLYVSVRGEEGAAGAGSLSVSGLQLAKTLPSSALHRKSVSSSIRVGVTHATAIPVLHPRPGRRGTKSRHLFPFLRRLRLSWAWKDSRSSACVRASRYC